VSWRKEGEVGGKILGSILLLFSGKKREKGKKNGTSFSCAAGKKRKWLSWAKGLASSLLPFHGGEKEKKRGKGGL